MDRDPRLVFLDSMLNGDIETSLSFIHPDCIIRHPPGVSYGGDLIGPEGFRGLLGALFGAFDMDLERTESLLVDDYLIVRFWATFIHKESKKATTQTVAEFYRFQDGLVVEGDNYYKSPEVVAALMEESSA